MKFMTWTTRITTEDYKEKNMGLKIGLQPPHPGGFIKRSVLPDDLSVTDAALILKVGRPALSNLLNQNAALSPEMALRIEKAFGVKMDTLLRMQTRYDAWQMRQREGDLTVERYAPA
jgi:antitoxin HigA-1